VFYNKKMKKFTFKEPHIIQYGETIQKSLVLWPGDPCEFSMVKTVPMESPNALELVRNTISTGTYKSYTIFTVNRNLMPLTLLNKKTYIKTIKDGLTADISAVFLHVMVSEMVLYKCPRNITSAGTLYLMRWRMLQCSILSWSFVFVCDCKNVQYISPNNIGFIFNVAPHSSLQNITNKLASLPSEPKLFVCMNNNGSESGDTTLYYDLKRDAHCAILFRNSSSVEWVDLCFFSDMYIQQPCHAISLPSSYRFIHEKWPSHLLPEYSDQHSCYIYCLKTQKYIPYFCPSPSVSFLSSVFLYQKELLQTLYGFFIDERREYGEFTEDNEEDHTITISTTDHLLTSEDSTQQ